MNRKTVNIICALLAALIIAFVAGYQTGMQMCGNVEIVERDTIIYVDTIPYYKPVAKDSAVVRYITKLLPVAHYEATDTFLAENYAQNGGENIPPLGLTDERDSMAVEIPITQKYYEGEEYRAFVSGFQPSLDSIFVFPRSTLIRETTYKPPNKWHIGITGGYGYGFKSRQAEPYIGIGITYSIISF